MEKSSCNADGMRMNTEKIKSMVLTRSVTNLSDVRDGEVHGCDWGCLDLNQLRGVSCWSCQGIVTLMCVKC